MSNILSECHNFNFSETYGYADKVRKAIFDDDYIIEPVELASDIEGQIAKPQKHTILHDFIDYIISEDLRFYFNDAVWDDNCSEPVMKMLALHDIEFKSIETYVAGMYKEDGSDEEPLVTQEMLTQYAFEYNTDYVSDIAEEHLVPILVVEVFNLLFCDREAMMQFNIRIADYLQTKTPRCTYWPKWLERALFCREKGLCAICKSDLSSIYHTHGRLAIDHIVPIALYGINDPTNLQILCEACNGSKSSHEIHTSNALPVFW